MTEDIYPDFPLAIEGKPTTDGRLIMEGALTWPDEPIPVTHWSAGGEIIGKVENMRRPGDGLIVGDVTLFDQPRLGPGDLTIGCTPVPPALRINFTVPENIVLIHDGLIRYAVRSSLVGPIAWPWSSKPSEVSE